MCGIAGYYDQKGVDQDTLVKMNKILSFLPFIFYIRPKLRNYLKSVLNGFSYYSRTGKSVPRNNWGKHSWFS